MQYKSTKEAILAKINEFLEKHPEVTPQGFGLESTRDTSLVLRLQAGGDITTRKLDMILYYLRTYKPKPTGETNAKENEKA